jgi:tetratricopeptide (TPR) repeat protein
MPRIIDVTSLAISLLLFALPARVTFAQADPKADARAHFEKGLAAFDARRLDEAAAEFDAAYRLSPAFVVLYNIGQVSVALGHPIEAVQAFTQYLDQGGSAIPGARQREVRAEIDVQTARIGTLAIFVRPDGAEIRVDARLVGEAPLRRPPQLAAGKHTIHVTLTNYVADVRDIDIVGGQQLEIQVDLAPVVAPPLQSSLPPPAPAQEAAAPPPGNDITETTHGNGQKIAGYVLAGAGIVATGIGFVLALTSVSQADGAKRLLGRATTGTAWDDAKSDYDAAKNRNRIGWIVAGCGLASVIAGTVLVVTSPAIDPAQRGLHVELAPWLLPATAGLSARSSW